MNVLHKAWSQDEALGHLKGMGRTNTPINKCQMACAQRGKVKPLFKWRGLRQRMHHDHELPSFLVQYTYQIAGNALTPIFKQIEMVTRDINAGMQKQRCYEIRPLRWATLWWQGHNLRAQENSNGRTRPFDYLGLA